MATPQTTTATTTTIALNGIPNATNAPVQHPDWTVGDVTITSADNVVFKIQSYHLMSASTMWRDLTSLCEAHPPITQDAEGDKKDDNKPQLVLCDLDFESSDVVETVLKVVTQGCVPSFKNTPVWDTTTTTTTTDSAEILKRVDDVLKFFHFIGKYEFGASEELAVRQLEGSHQVLPVWIVGACTHNNRLMSGPMISEPQFAGWNCRKLPFWVWNKVPAPYLCALDMVCLEPLFGEKETPKQKAARFLAAAEKSFAPREFDGEPTADEQWNVGPVAFISTDGVLFRTPAKALAESCHFQTIAAEARAADRKGEEPPAPMMLTIGTAATVRAVLNLTTKGKLTMTPLLTQPVPEDGNWGDDPWETDLLTLVMFLKTYGFARLFNVIVRKITAWLEARDMMALDAVFIGAAAEDTALCIRALELKPSHHTALPPWFWHCLPLDWLWAILRTLDTVRQDRRTNSKEVFLRSLGEAGAILVIDE